MEGVRYQERKVFHREEKENPNALMYKEDLELINDYLKTQIEECIETSSRLMENSSWGSSDEVYSGKTVYKKKTNETYSNNSEQEIILRQQGRMLRRNSSIEFINEKESKESSDGEIKDEIYESKDGFTNQRKSDLIRRKPTKLQTNNRDRLKKISRTKNETFKQIALEEVENKQNSLKTKKFYENFERVSIFKHYHSDFNVNRIITKANFRNRKTIDSFKEKRDKILALLKNSSVRSLSPKKRISQTNNGIDRSAFSNFSAAMEESQLLKRKESLNSSNDEKKVFQDLKSLLLDSNRQNSDSAFLGNEEEEEKDRVQE